MATSSKQHAMQASARQITGAWHRRWNSWRSPAVTLRTIAKRTLAPIACAGISLCSQALNAQTMVDGSAMITSHSGSASITTDAGRSVTANAHEILKPPGLQIATTNDSRLFLTLSNGVALAFDGGTSAKFLEYMQRPFNKDAQELGPEPSISKLRLQLTEGQLAIASNRLSPLSELRILLPKGEIRLHKGTCFIQLNATGLHITALEGNLTYYYPGTNAREFISAPNRVRISEQSIQRQEVAQESTVDSLEPDELHFCRAAQHASKRVTFMPNETSGQPPEPKRIVRPEYFKQADFRPYQFKD